MRTRWPDSAPLPARATRDARKRPAPCPDRATTILEPWHARSARRPALKGRGRWAVSVQSVDMQQRTSTGMLLEKFRTVNQV